MTTMQTAPLADVAEVVRGVTFSKSEAVAKPAEGFLPVLRAGNIQDRLILDEDLVFVPKNKVHTKQIIRKGDIIICTSSGSAEVVGKTAYADVDWNGSFGAFCAGIRVKSAKADPAYIFHFLRSPHFRSWTQKSSGANIKNIRKSELDLFEVPLPSLSEQRRIASILEKADGIRRKREQSLRLADDVVRSSFLERFGHPLDPNGRLVRSDLGENCDFFAGGSLPKGEAFTGQEDGLLLIKVSDLNASGNEVTIGTAKLWTPSRSTAKGGVIAPRGSVVFPKRGGAIATNKKRVLERDCVLDPNLMAVAPKPKSIISCNYMRTWFELIDLASISSGSSVPQLNKKDLAPLAFGVPEREAVDWFDGVFERVDVMKRRLRAALAEADTLFASVSQRAFRGEL